MKKELFRYELPPERIAKFPLSDRDASKLFLVSKTQGEHHLSFSDLPDWLRAEDVLVLNDTKVVSARLIGKRKTGAKIEILILQTQEDRALAMVQGRGRVQEGEVLLLEGEEIPCLLEKKTAQRGRWWVRFPGVGDARKILHAGRAPIPPYISKARGKEEAPDFDLERYQTVFASRDGAVAAPTAGLHFTRQLLDRIRARGTELAYLTLHVGAGTFLPVRVEDIEDHRLEPERYSLSEETAKKIATRRQAGGRVIAVGTTVTRVLETVTQEDGSVSWGEGETAKFIFPPYRFRGIDALITNFHLPESSLLMLVSALIGREQCLRLYREAVEKDYRFFSYGDAMFLIP